MPRATNPQVKGGDVRTFNEKLWEQSPWPKTAQGVGYTEVPRGALAHGVVIKGDRTQPLHGLDACDRRGDCRRRGADDGIHITRAKAGGGHGRRTQAVTRCGIARRGSGGGGESRARQADSSGA
ncbi:MAG: nickel-dependent hydrogenase large subunit [Acidiferrobacterales bacterium]